MLCYFVFILDVKNEYYVANLGKKNKCLNLFVIYFQKKEVFFHN